MPQEVRDRISASLLAESPPSSLTENKRCNQCKVTKPAVEFDRRPLRSGGETLRALCKACFRVSEAAKFRRRAAANPEAVKATARRTRLRRRFGMTEADYEEMAAAQDGKCAICGTTEPGCGMGSLPVDHCHATGRVRGLLCSACNTVLGLARDDPDRLRAAIEYLARESPWPWVEPGREADAS